jgi:hypothetical protein
MRWRLAVACTEVLLVSRAPAQEAPGGERPLAGPTIPTEVLRTLVRHDARGNFQRLDVRAEAAALDHIEAEQGVRDKAREVVGERAIALGVFLVENIERVAEIMEAREAGRREKAGELLRELWHDFEEGEPWAPLMNRLEAVLPMECMAEARRLVEEYWNAWIDWELRNARDRSAPARERARRRLAFTVFQDEVRQAYEQVIRPYQQRVEVLFQSVEPTEEQRGAIREAVIAYIRESRAKPTREQRVELMTRIYGLLDEGRRARFFELVANQAAGE